MTTCCPTCGEVCNRQLEDELNKLRRDAVKRREALRFVVAYFADRGQTTGNRAYAFAKEALED